jgi:hypothetical protein
MKQLAQGLAKPLSIMDFISGPRSWKEGDDVTDVIGVRKHDTEDIALAGMNLNSKKRPWYHYWLRKLPFIGEYFNKPKGTFPDHIVGRTDETRMENVHISDLDKMAKCGVEITEKLDGTSTTVIYKKRGWLMRKLFGDEFLVCSRNMTVVHEDDSWWWSSVRQNGLREKIEKIYDKMALDGCYLSLQGETLGKRIQANRYALKDNEFRFRCFNLIVNKNGICHKLSNFSMSLIAEEFGVECVPLLAKVTPGQMTGQQLKEFIKSRPWGTASVINDKMKYAEGIVVRAVDQDPKSVCSFKWVYPEFLLKNDE